VSTVAVRRPGGVWAPGARALGSVEARRLLRHPAYAIGLTFIAVFAVSTSIADGVDTWPNVIYIVLALALLLIYAPVTIIAANRVAAATFRRRSRAALDAAPMSDRQRIVALVVGLVRGPVLVAFACSAALLLLQPATSSTGVDPSNVVIERNPLEYLEIPALVLGAGLLGIAIARWLPWPGTMPVLVLAVWLGTIAMYKSAGPDGVIPTQTWFALWPVWVASESGMAMQQPLHREMAHLAYLLGLGGLAGVAALFRSAGSRRAMWGVGAVAAVVTGLGAWLQLV
jgi:hypothetical protein